jgi:hypothetical protein
MPNATVLKYTGSQLWTLSELMRNPAWMQKDRSVIIIVGIMYIIFVMSVWGGQRKKRADDRYFVDGVKGE